MFASRPCRLALTVTCRQIVATPYDADAPEQAENGQKLPVDGVGMPAHSYLSTSKQLRID